MAEPGAGEYTGIENLEVMAEAANYNRFLERRVLERARPGDHVVDFGAGSGTFARPVRDAGFRISCVEPDERLRARLEADGLTVVRSLSDLPDGSVDYLYTLNVLEHIRDDESVLREFHRVLSPGGRLLIYVPAFEVLYSSMDRKVGHLRRYRLRPLRSMVNDAGLSVERVRYVDSLGFLASLAFRLGDPGDGEINRRALRAYDRFVFPVSRLLDGLAGTVFGKNLLLYGHRPTSGPTGDPG